VQINPSSPVDGITWSLSGITPSSSSLLESAFYNDNFTPQSPSSIDTAVSGWFGVTLTNLPTGNSDLSGQTFTYGGPSANVFAIHIGQGEFAFLFSAGVAGFTFTENGHALSNVRAYCSLSSCAASTNPPDDGPPLATTPLPGAGLLMSSIIGLGLGAARLRRRRAKGASV
jgi:hypothetical protein